MSDNLYVNRDNTTYQVDMENLRSIEDTDLLLVNRDGTTYTVTGDKVGGGATNDLIAVIPPFGGLTTSETRLVSSDSKVEFSLDGLSYSNDLTVPIDTFYYVDWGTDILSAPQDSNYQAEITASRADLGISNTITFEIKKIDKLPDPFDFTDTVDDLPDSLITSDVKSPLLTINAPATIWVASDAPLFELRIGNGNWFDPPSLPNTAYVSPNEEIQVRHKTGLGSDTTYTTDVNVGYGAGAGEFVTATFASTTQAIAIGQIEISGGGTGISVQPSFTTSPYSEVGGAGTHASTDWQIATDAEFTNIVTQSISDTTSKTSWTPYVTNSADAAPGKALGRLDGNTTYYVRAKYTSTLGYESNYAVTTITTEVLITDFTTSSQDINIPSTTDSFEHFTVPNSIGRIRVTVNGRAEGTKGFSNPSGGGKVRGTFDVVPGEKIRVYNAKGALGLFEDIDMERSNVIVMAGNSGGGGFGREANGGTCTRGSDLVLRGGVGGGDNGANGVAGPQSNNEGPPSGGLGASQNGPGSAGANSPEGKSQVRQPAAGNGFAGGLGGKVYDDGDKTESDGGNGGAGWYGGGGGGANYRKPCHPATGGGGSSRFQPVIWRDGSIDENTSGGSLNQTAFVTIEW